MDYSIIPIVSYVLGYLSSKMAHKEVEDKSKLFSCLVVVTVLMLSVATMRQYPLLSVFLLISIIDFKLLSFVLPIYSIFSSHIVVMIMSLSILFLSTLSFINKKNYLFYIVLGSCMVWLI